MNLEIVIAQRGWVFVGFIEEKADKIIITSCRNIRRWGTKKGLGEIALNGPTETTVLDEYGTISLHPLSIVARILCATEKWKL